MKDTKKIENARHWIEDVKDEPWRAVLKDVQKVGLKYGGQVSVQSVMVLQSACESLRVGDSYEQWRNRVHFMDVPKRLQTKKAKRFDSVLLNVIR